MKAEPVYVQAVGMACPLGWSWPAICAAMRAGITRKSFSPYRDDNGREIVASYLHDDIIGEDTAVDRRRLFLLSRALEDLSRSENGSWPDKTPMFIALPSSSTGKSSAGAVLAEALSYRLGVRIAHGNVLVFGEGAYGGYVALHQARTRVSAGQPCIVAAADSLISAEVLLKLSEQRRLLVEGNSDGLTPGEAAVRRATST